MMRDMPNPTAQAAATGLDLTVWAEITLTDAMWTASFSRQQQRNAALGVTPEALDLEFSRLEDLRRRATG